MRCIRITREDPRIPLDDAWSGGLEALIRPRVRNTPGKRTQEGGQDQYDRELVTVN